MAQLLIGDEIVGCIELYMSNHVYWIKYTNQL